MATYPLTPYTMPNYPPVAALNQPNLPINQNILTRAVQMMADIRHLPGDDAYLSEMGVSLPYRNGQEALQQLRLKGVNITFGDMGESTAHAMWDAEKNTILINQRYQGDNSLYTLYGISEALYHEAGHVAKLGDNTSSIQEEINCLALNTVANRFHAAMDPSYAQHASQSRLIADGVALYPKLFFDPDPSKQALIKRVITKYGMLPSASPDHPVPPTSNGSAALTDQVLRTLHDNPQAPYWVEDLQASSTPQPFLQEAVSAPTAFTYTAPAYTPPRQLASPQYSWTA